MYTVYILHTSNTTIYIHKKHHQKVILFVTFLILVIDQELYRQLGATLLKTRQGATSPPTPTTSTSLKGPPSPLLTLRSGPSPQARILPMLDKEAFGPNLFMQIKIHMLSSLNQGAININMIA